MPYFPSTPSLRNSINIGTVSLESIGVQLIAVSSSSAASNAWPNASGAILIPIEIVYPTTIAKMMVNNGIAVSGNIDVGIYGEGWKQIVSMGSTAQAGTSAIQIFDIADTLLEPGLYYMAIAIDNTIGTLAGFTVSASIDAAPFGLYQQASAFPLPATLAPTPFSGTFIPLVSMTPLITI